MTEKSMHTFRRIYGICLAVLTVLVGALFIVAVQGVYHSSEKTPYTVDSISREFGKIALPFFLWLIAVAVGGVLSWIVPEAQEKPAAYVELGKTLGRLKRRLPEEGTEVKRSARLRLAAKIVCATLCFVAAGVSLFILFNENYTPRFEEHVFTENGMAADRLVAILPWIFAALLICAGVAIFNSFVVKKEISLVKSLIAENAKKGLKATAKAERVSFTDRISGKIPFLKTGLFLWIVRAALGVLACVLIVVGIFNGGMADVLAKAIAICTQCIGLG